MLRRMRASYSPPYIENAGTYTFMKTKTDNDAKFTIACVA